MKVEVRTRVPADDPEWLRLRTGLWPDLSAATHRAEMHAWLARRDAVVLVASRPGEKGLIGFAEVGTRSIADGCESSPVAYLEGWYADTDARRGGVGAALVGAAEAWARQRGLRELASDTELENIDAQKAHEALGFKEVERAVLYSKAL